MRLVGVDALTKLMNLVTREIETPELARRITEVLVPQEFTRVDSIVDLVFFTAEDATGASLDNDERPEGEDAESLPPRQTARFNEACIARCASELGLPLIQRSRSLYSAPDSAVLVICLVSREYQDGRQQRFWYAFSDHHKDALDSAHTAWIALGCGSADTVLLIPWADFRGWLEGIHTTTRETGRYYWHIQVLKRGAQYRLARRARYPDVAVAAYLLPATTSR